jgi:hypothetical protein
MRSSAELTGVSSVDEQCATLAHTTGVGVDHQAPPVVPAQEPKGLIPGIGQEPQLSPAESRFEALWRGLELILNHHRVPPDVLMDAKCQIRKYLMSADDEATFVGRAKYLLAAPMAVYTRNELPPKPDVAFDATGVWKAWSRTRMVVCTNNTHLWYSWFQCKRCAETLTDDMILRTYQKHRVAMGKPDPITAKVRDRVMAELKSLLRELNRKLLKVYRSMNWNDWDEALDCEEAEHVASLRACYEASRAKGGQMGAIKDLLWSDRLNGKDVSQREEFSTAIPDRTEVLPVCADKVVRPFAFATVSRFPAGEAEWADAVVAQADADLSQGALKATIQAVLEPLKVRVISKGNAAPYYLAKLFQKKLHGIMREYPFFRLIGRKLCPTDLLDLKKHSVLGGAGPLGWASIDFAAATDNLSASLSKEIMDVLTEGFPKWWKDLLMQCLAPHFCEYPKVDGVELDPIQQENGQLMGSIVSFLVLCLANAGVTLAATAEEDPRDWYSRLQGVLINGDDNGFACRRSVYDTFAWYAGACGLEMSVGKAYWHPTIFNINSTCFHYNLVDPTATPKCVPYLNTGLFFGKGKVMGKTDETTDPRMMTAVINEVVGGARAGRQSDLLKQYLALHRDQIADECRGRNLFIPIELGGMGIDMPPGWKTEVTIAQQTLAGKIMAANPNMWQTGLGPAPSGPVDERPPPEEAPWLAPTQEKIPYRGVGAGIRRSRKRKGFFESSGLVFRPLGKRKCFIRAVTCDRRRPCADFVPYEISQVEEDFAITLINMTAGSVYTLDELAATARAHLPRLVVHHRDRDCSIDASLGVWERMGASLRLDIEMDHEFDTLLTAIAWIAQ